MQAQVNQARPHGFQYAVEHVCNSADGYALVLSSIVNREPPFNFAYLEGYEPVERGLQDNRKRADRDRVAFPAGKWQVCPLVLHRPEALV